MPVPRIALESVSSASTAASVKVSLDKIPNGGGGFVSLGVRTIGTSDYRAKVKVASQWCADAVPGEGGQRDRDDLDQSTTLGAAFNYSVGSTLKIRAEATGVSPTTV